MKVTLQEREYASVPTEGKWFKVNPLEIDQNLFKEKKRAQCQEKTRQLILEAFEEVKKNSKYARPFRTMMPKKTWERKRVGILIDLAYTLGDHNADWVEQALEWAQRIANGESWEDICNKGDSTDWYRLVIWKKGFKRYVGGSRAYFSLTLESPSSVSNNYRDLDSWSDYLGFTVPLVVDYDE